MAPSQQSPTVNLVDAPTLADPQFYSHGVSINGAGRLILTSGQIGQRKDGTFPATFGEQVKQAVANLVDVLKAAGSTPRDIVQLRFYCVDWSIDLGHDLFGPVLALLTESYGLTYRPLTTLVPVPKLAYDEVKFEIEAVASVGGLSRPWTTADGHLPDVDRTAIANRFPVAAAEVDVLVVGGGLSGLMAAYECHQAGLTAIVLEARNRIGGRSYSSALRSGAGVIELGGTWINKTTQPVIYSLTQKFGLETSEQYTTGAEVFQGLDGRPIRTTDLTSPREGEDAETTESTQRLFHLIAEAAEKQDIRRWADFPEAEDVSMAGWLQQQGLDRNASVRAQLSNFTSAVVGREPHETGAQYLFDYLKSGRGFLSIISEGELGAQSLKVKKGTSAIAMALASAIGHGNVLIQTPVASIMQHDSGFASVTTLSGQIFRAKKIILANPTNTYTKIDFSPPLPYAKRALVSRTKPGVYAKMVVSYTSPWWREAGLVGKFTSLLGPICFSWDTSSLEDKQYSLAFFIAGDKAASWHTLSELAREEAVIEHLAVLVGPELAEKARDVLEVNYVEWTKQEYIEGAPTSAMGSGLLRKYGSDLRAPFGNVHFAGGELAYEWKGYLEGAITSGQRAAQEVIDLLEPAAKESSKL